MKDLIKNDLPNFPDEIIEDWILGHYSSWPPSNLLNCDPKLLFRSLDFWKNVEWSLEDFQYSDFSFSEDPGSAILATAGSFSFDTKNPLSIFEEITGKRYVDILSYTLEHGKSPKPVSLLREQDTFSIADGHHRIYALRVATSITNKLGEMDGEYLQKFKALLKEKWNVDSIKPPIQVQKVWIATPR